ncbi:hypothetical protein QFC21_005001 [Naganishia friedmannii]|uniref:Uncharacterized protein n=1 Tax=Naganishia friedmannii TaxID=89922 RepID=A0ACC2VDN7_9TREE|nr:hypothetical protein QFC21_005001 [Naganishia friedmannii]
MPDFSTPAEHAFEEPTPDPSATATSASLSNTSIPLYERYEITSTIEEILENGYNTIALQFPDELLAESVLVYRALMKGIQESGGDKAEGVQCYVLGDSTYGRTASVPVRYVFPKRSLDVKAVAAELYSTAFPDGTATMDESLQDGQLPDDREARGRKGVVVIWDVAYDWIEGKSCDYVHGRQLNFPCVQMKSSRYSPTLRANRKTCNTSSSQPSTRLDSPWDLRRGPYMLVDAVPPHQPRHHAVFLQKRQREDLPAVRHQLRPLAHLVAKLRKKNRIKGNRIHATPAASSETGSAAQAQGVEITTTTPTNHEDAAARQLDALHISQQPESLRTLNFPPDVRMMDCTIFYIGEETRGLINLMMENAENRIYQYAPDDGCVYPLHVKSPRLLSRRLFALHSSFSASTYGILVHNVGLARSHGLVKHLRKLLKDKGKKSYTVSVGRVNPAKLANFEVVDCWVLVGCLEGGLVDTKEYYKPILTPWELQLSLQGDRGVWAPDQWTLDFRRVLADLEEEHGKIQEEGRADATNDGENDSDNDTPVYSLVTGELHSVRRFGHREDKAKEVGGETQDALVVRNQENALAQRHGLESVAANHLAQRQWMGLDPTEGLKGEKWEPSMLEEGRRGIAKGYRVDGIGREG